MLKLPFRVATTREREEEGLPELRPLMLGNGGVKNLKKNSRGAFTVGEGWEACLPCTPRFVKIATTKAVR